MHFLSVKLSSIKLYVDMIVLALARIWRIGKTWDAVTSLKNISISFTQESQFDETSYELQLILKIQTTNLLEVKLQPLIRV